MRDADERATSLLPLDLGLLLAEILELGAGEGIRVTGHHTRWGEVRLVGFATEDYVVSVYTDSAVF